MMTVVRAEERDVGVIQAVVDELPLPPELHQAQRAQDAKMLGYCRLADADDGRDVAGAEFLLEQEVDDLGAGGIR